MKTPNSKHQAPEKLQAPSFKSAVSRRSLVEVWKLKFLRSLEVGVWCFRMRLGTVIGRVTLNKAVPALLGARWLIISPFTREHFQRGHEALPGLSKDPSLVVYDDLGGGVGQTVGFVEGREAAAPFEEPTPVDAINAALVDEIFYNPFSR